MSSSLSSFKIKTITITNKTTSSKSAPAVAAGAPKRLKRPILKNRSSRQRRLAALSFQSPRSATCNRLWSCKGTFTFFGLILLFVSSQFPFSEEEAFHFVRQGKVLHTGEPHQEGEHQQSTNKDSDTNTKPKQHTSGLDTALRSAFASKLNHTHLFHNLAASKSLSSASNSENNNINSSPEHNPTNDKLLQRARRHVQKDSVDDPFTYWGKKLSKAKNVKFIDRDESTTVAGIELQYHGDVGPGAARSATLLNMRRIGTKTIFAHTHEPGTEEGAMCAGTSTRLRLGYNAGPSSWMNSHVAVYPNGKRTHLFIVDGQWTY